MNKIRLILWKEWIELRQEKTLVLTSLLLPLVFAVGPVIFAFIIKNLDAKSAASMMKSSPDLSGVNPALKGMNAIEVTQALIGLQVGVLLLILPTIISSVVASYSVVGEKTSRTLEPLLATPVTTLELLLAKTLTALIPSVLITWISGAIFTAGMAFASVSGRVFNAIISPSWLILLLLWAPLISLTSIGFTVAISSRANDPRSAQQISAILILPIVGLFIGQISGVLVFGPFVVFIGAVVLALLAAGAVWLSVGFFQRESILTKLG